MTNLREIFAHNLKAKRQKCGITQAKVERIANALDIEVYELFIAKPSPENEMERLHNTLVGNIEKVVTDAIEKTLAAKYKDKE